MALARPALLLLLLALQVLGAERRRVELYHGRQLVQRCHGAHGACCHAARGDGAFHFARLRNLRRGDVVRLYRRAADGAGACAGAEWRPPGHLVGQAGQVVALLPPPGSGDQHGSFTGLRVEHGSERRAAASSEKSSFSSEGSLSRFRGLSL